MWTKLLDVAQGTKTSHDLLFELLQEFSKTELGNVTNFDAHFFFPGRKHVNDLITLLMIFPDPPKVLPASSNTLESGAAPDSPLPRCTTPPASSPGIVPVSSAPLAVDSLISEWTNLAGMYLYICSHSCSADSGKDDAMVGDFSSDQGKSSRIVDLFRFLQIELSVSSGLRGPSAVPRRSYVSSLNFSIPESLASSTSSSPDSPGLDSNSGIVLY